MSRLFRLLLGFEALFICSCALSTVAHAAWSPTGIRIAGQSTLDALISDGSGGAIVVFAPLGGDSVRVVRLDTNGEVAPGWPSNGRGVPSGQHMGSAGDGAGGVYVVLAHSWVLNDDPVDMVEVRAWHVTSGGAFASGWPDSGRVVGQYGGIRAGAARAGFDDSGTGAVVSFTLEDSHTGASNLVVARFTADDSVSTTTPGRVDSPWRGGSCVDGVGGVAYTDTQDGYTIAMHRSPAGIGIGAILLVPQSDPVQSGVAEAGPSSDVLVWWNRESPADPYAYPVMGGRFNELINAASGWPSTGIELPVWPVCSDGQGGFFGVTEEAVRKLQRFRLDTPTPILQWSSDSLSTYHWQGLHAIDGSGGLFHAWFADVGIGLKPSLYAKHFSNNGTPQAPWTDGGVQISPAAASPWAMTSAGPGRALLAWTDNGSDSVAIYLQLLADDAVVPAMASLVDAHAWSDRVRVEWQVPGHINSLDVERRRADEPWTHVGVATLSGDERWSFEDRDVRAGEAMSYRLVSPTGALPGSEALVQVPAPAAFSLRGFVQNPVGADGSLEFTLPDAAPAKLQVLDIAGRLLASREVGALGAGTHRLELRELHAVGPGLVFARLSRGGVVRVARGTLLR